MKRLFGVVAIGLIITGCSDQSTAAPATTRSTAYEVLGLHVGDAMAKAESMLGQKGFSRTEQSRFDAECHASLDAFLGEMIKKGKTGVTPNDGNCERKYAKPGSGVTVFYAMGPSGHVVNQVIYSFPTADQQTVVTELTRKFGKPSRTVPTQVSWGSSPENQPFEKERLSYDIDRSGDSLVLAAGYEGSRNLAKQTSAVLARRTGRRSPEL